MPWKKNIILMKKKQMLEYL